MKKGTKRALGFGAVLVGLGLGLLGKEAIDGNLGKKKKYAEIDVDKDDDELDAFYESRKEEAD